MAPLWNLAGPPIQILPRQCLVLSLLPLVSPGSFLFLSDEKTKRLLRRFSCSQIAVSSSGEPVAGLNCRQFSRLEKEIIMIIIYSLPDISAIGQVGGWRGCSPPAVRYRSTSSLFLPAYFPPSPLTKGHSNSNGALNAKPMYRKGSPTQRLVPKRKSTGAPSSHQSCSCGSKVTVNGQHHCDFLLYSPS